jgi:hypothetical protein
MICRTSSAPRSSRFVGLGGLAPGEELKMVTGKQQRRFSAWLTDNRHVFAGLQH